MIFDFECHWKSTNPLLLSQYPRSVPFVPLLCAVSFLFLSACLSPWRSVCLFVCLSICLLMCLFLSLCVCLFLSLCVCLFLSLCVCLFLSWCVCLFLSWCVCLFVYMCVSLFASLCVCPSIFQSVYHQFPFLCSFRGRNKRIGFRSGVLFKSFDEKRYST
jgi:hypothetical protein